MISDHSGDWVLVEDERELKPVAELLSDESQTAVITPSPKVYHELSNKSQRVVGLNEFISKSEFDAIAERCREFSFEVCEKLDERFTQRYPDQPAGFNPFDVSANQLARTIVPLAARRHELRKFIEAKRPGSLRYWARESETFDTEGMKPLDDTRSPLFWSGFESISARLLAEPWPDTDCVGAIEPITEIKREDYGTDSSGKTDRLKDWTKRALNPNRVDGLRETDFEFLGWPGRDPDRFLVVERNPFVWGFLEDAVDRRPVDIDLWYDLSRSPVSVRTGRSISLLRRTSTGMLPDWEEAAAAMVETVWPSTTEKWSVDTLAADVMAERLTQYAKSRIPLHRILYDKGEDYAKRRDPTAVVGGPLTQPRVQVLSQAASASGIPTVSFQHGGAYGYVHHPVMYNELKYEVFCSFGPDVSEWIEQYASDEGWNLDAVSIGLDRLRAKYETVDISPASIEFESHIPEEVDTPTLVYAPTLFMRHRRYGPNFWVADIDYYHHQKEVIDYLADVDGFEVLFKPHYKTRSPTPFPEYIEQQAYTGIQVIRGETLTKVLTSGDVVMLDSPATTLLEAMLLDTHVVYFDIGWFEWLNDAERIVRDSVTYIDTSEDWKRSLDRELARIRGSTQTHEKFLNKYCTPEYTPEELWALLDDDDWRSTSHTSL